MSIYFNFSYDYYLATRRRHCLNSNTVCQLVSSERNQLQNLKQQLYKAIVIENIMKICYQLLQMCSHSYFACSYRTPLTKHTEMN